MAVSSEELAEIDNILSGDNAIDFAELKSRFPHLKWTRCDASDVIETPYRSYRCCDVHLLDASEHCVQVTAEPESANGLVLAYRKAAS